MTYRPLTLREAEYVAHRLAIETMNKVDEPIPPFHTRTPGMLESCLQQPFQTVGGKYAHHYFARRVAVLFYLITKNHCFENGNKRMAVTLTAAFCYVNKKWIEVDNLTLYEIAKDVAESDPKKYDKMINVLHRFFDKYIVPRD